MPHKQPRQVDFKVSFPPTVNAEPSSGHRILWFSKILFHWPLELNSEPNFPILRIRWLEYKPQEQAHTGRTRKAPCIGYGFDRTLKAKGGGCISEGIVTVRQVWMAKLNYKDKLSQLPSCLKLVQTLVCFCNPCTSTLGHATNSVVKRCQ